MKVIKVSTDRKAGWNGLTEACRVISGNTIKVLQIVYGAQLRRLLSVADTVQGLLEGIDVALLRSDPQRFADLISELATKVAELGMYATQKALDEESPVTREEYAQKGAALTNQSDVLLAAANELLQNPDDSAVSDKFNQTLQETIDLVRYIILSLP